VRRLIALAILGLCGCASFHYMQAAQPYLGGDIRSIEEGHAYEGYSEKQLAGRMYRINYVQPIRLNDDSSDSLDSLLSRRAKELCDGAYTVLSNPGLRIHGSLGADNANQWVVVSQQLDVHCPAANNSFKPKPLRGSA